MIVTGGSTWNMSATPLGFFSGRLANPQFIQAGRVFSGAPDPYVYVHFPGASDPEAAYWDGNDYILTGRVRRNSASILDRAAYEFRLASGSWVADAGQAAPAFTWRHMVGQVHTFYNPGLRRYILPNYGFVDPDTLQPTGWHHYRPLHHGRPPWAQLTLFESKSPWGPWSLFHLQQPWNLHGGAGAYCPDFPSQWQSADGLTLRMVYSACCGQPEYSYHATMVRLRVAEQRL